MTGSPWTGGTEPGPRPPQDPGTLVQVWARGRQLTAGDVHAHYWERTRPGRIPVPGDTVLFRLDPAAELVPVVVDEVGTDGPSDPNVYAVETGRTGVLRADPAPLVSFRHPRTRQPMVCREARVPEQPGWVWPDDEGGTRR